MKLHHACRACRWTWYFLFSALHVCLAGWTFAGPPVVGNWAAGLITMINQFKAGNGAMSPLPRIHLHARVACVARLAVTYSRRHAAAWSLLL